MKKRFLPLCLGAGLAAIVWAAAAGRRVPMTRCLPLLPQRHLYLVAVDKRVDTALDASEPAA